MKKMMYFVSCAVMTLMPVSCSNEELDDVLPFTNERVAQTATLVFEGSKPDFVDEGITRATTDSWANGSKIYLQFMVGSGRVDGVATYTASTQEWAVEYYGALQTTNDGKCEAYYFENAGNATYSSVELTSSTAIYMDNVASYSFEDNVVKVTANLKPMTGRIRLKGGAYQAYDMEGVTNYNKYDFTANSFESEKKTIVGTTAKDGYSNYIYGYFEDADNKMVLFNDKENNLAYTKVLGSNALAVGKSGYLNIPTLDNRSGWGILASKDYTVGNVTFKMIRVVCGSFQMMNEYPVTLTKSYYMGETEVTQALWSAVMSSNPSTVKGDKLPVNNISWDDCQAFISKLNTKTGGNFRLPTEAEWEFAARGANKSQDYIYSGSNNIEDVAWYYSNSSSTIHPVKEKNSNEILLYDMSGNVNEFCQDGDHVLFEGVDPIGGIGSNYKMYRGGSYRLAYDYQKVICRTSTYYAQKDNSYGFRLASY